MDSKLTRILWKRRQKKTTTKDEQNFFSLFHKPDFEYKLKEELYRELFTSNTYKLAPEKLHNMYSRLWKNIKQERLIKYLKQSSKIAAILFIGLITGFLVSHFYPTKPSNFTANSPLGSISEWTLPDSSSIFLNSGSEIRYNSNNKYNKREIFLTGEAWFNVKKNSKIPFIVHTPFYDINVKGTEFNVKAYPEDALVTTTLEKGKIIITSSKNKFFKKGIHLKPGQQISFAKNSTKPKIKTVNPKWYSAWKDNKLILVNMPLKELIILLERKYGVSIIIKDSEILNYHCDGTFKNESIIEVLEILKEIIAIDYRVVDQSIEIISDKKNINYEQ